MVIVGAVPAAFTVIEKLVGPALPAAFVIITAILPVALTVGVPLSKPDEDSVSPVGTPVAE